MNRNEQRKDVYFARGAVFEWFERHNYGAKITGKS